jgi:hypothetical protein
MPSDFDDTRTGAELLSFIAFPGSTGGVFAGVVAVICVEELTTKLGAAEGVGPLPDSSELPSGYPAFRGISRMLASVRLALQTAVGRRKI